MGKHVGDGGCGRVKWGGWSGSGRGIRMISAGGCGLGEERYYRPMEDGGDVATEEADWVWGGKILCRPLIGAGPQILSASTRNTAPTWPRCTCIHTGHSAPPRPRAWPTSPPAGGAFRFTSRHAPRLPPQIFHFLPGRLASPCPLFSEATAFACKPDYLILNNSTVLYFLHSNHIKVMYLCPEPRLRSQYVRRWETP